MNATPTSITIDARTFKRLVAPVIPWASTDTVLPLLCSVRLEVRGDWLTAAATDRYRVAMKRVRLEAGDDDILPTGFSIAVRTTDLRTVQRLWRPTRTENPLMRLSIRPVDDEHDALVVEAAGAMFQFDELRAAFPSPATERFPYPAIDRLLVEALSRDALPPTTAFTPRLLNDLTLGQEGGEPVIFWGGSAGPDDPEPGRLKPVALSIGEDFIGAIVPVGRTVREHIERPSVASWVNLLAGPSMAATAVTAVA